MSTAQQQINEIVMEKLDGLSNQISDLKVAIAGIPQIILNSADERYASKAAEIRLNNLESRIESRNYDWLKQFAATLITIVIAMTVYSQIK
jgi:hypothetical protein